jgi:hypothetical protein
MNAEIARTQRQVLDLYEKQRAYLAGKPRQLVEDLMHEADDLRHSPTFSLRTSGEINHAACSMVLEAKQ